MTENTNSRKQKRAESDASILRSAIENFGRVGYTNCSVAQIARGAGVSPGLITQRYASKEDLFNEALATVFGCVAIDFDNVESVRSCLVNILHKAVNLKANKPEIFRFLVMAHNSTDTPTSYIKKVRQYLEKTNTYRLFEEAQRKGTLPEGDINNLLDSYIALVYLQVGICSKYGQELPPEEYFLGGIHYVDEEIESRKRWERLLSDVISSSFESMTYLNTEENYGEGMFTNNTKAVYRTNDARGEIEKNIMTVVSEEDRQKMREFYDFETINQRVAGRVSLGTAWKSIDNVPYRTVLMPVKNGNSDYVSEFIALIERMTQ